MEQAPLTWLEYLKRDSIDNWEQLKKVFTSNFIGSLGRHDNRMDLTQIKQKQGESLRDYRLCFFDKHASIIDVTDKEIINTFQQGIFDKCTYIDFGRTRPTTITKLKTFGPSLG
jgi:hypothetical protein